MIKKYIDDISNANNIKDFISVKKKIAREILIMLGIYDDYMEELLSHVYSFGYVIGNSDIDVSEEALKLAKENTITSIENISDNKICIGDFPWIETNPWCIYQDFDCENCPYSIGECDEDTWYKELVLEIERRILYKKVKEITDILITYRDKINNVHTLEEFVNSYNTMVNSILNTIGNLSIEITVKNTEIDLHTIKLLCLGTMNYIIDLSDKLNKYTVRKNNYVIACTIDFILYIGMQFMDKKTVNVLSNII